MCIRDSNETVVLSPFPLTEIGFANISALANLTLHFPPEISETSPAKVLFYPINSATKELTGFSYNSSGLESCWTFPSLKTAIRLDIVNASL